MDFDETIPDMISNKKFYPTVTELFIRGRNQTFLISQYYFAILKNVRLDITSLFIMKIPKSF